jgi:tetratricopeptide (TPR) repeat protein
MRRLLCGMLFAASFLKGAVPEACQTGADRFASGQYASAQENLWQCLDAGQASSEQAYQLAMTYRALRNYETGLRKTDSALTQSPNNVDLLFLAAYLHYRRNETKQSMLLTSKAYGIAPKDWRIHEMFALNYISFHMLEPARLSLLQAISLNSRNAELYYQLARLYFTLGSYVESIRISKQGLELAPDYPEMYHNLALSYEGSGNGELAVTNFRKAIELNRHLGRRDEWPLIDFAAYQRMGGQPEESLSLLREALAINPASPRANYEMGELLRDMRQYKEAATYLGKAIDLDPCNAKAIYGLALVSRTLGETDRSKALLQRFKEVDTAGRNPESKGCLEMTAAGLSALP